nr:MAG TPA: hypothetical protein [Caudoviricetes sp.]
MFAHIVAHHFKLNPWEVMKWNSEKLFKSYSFIKKTQGFNNEEEK